MCNRQLFVSLRVFREPTRPRARIFLPDSLPLGGVRGGLEANPYPLFLEVASTFDTENAKRVATERFHRDSFDLKLATS